MKLIILKIILTVFVGIALFIPIIYPSWSSGVLRELQFLSTPGTILVITVFFLLVYFYCKHLQQTLELIQPENRAAEPKSVWLMFLIPYNFIEDFFIIYNVSKSLEREATRNAVMKVFKGYGLYSGIGWCTAQIVSIFPGILGQTGGLIAIVLWFVHWRFIRLAIKELKKNDKKNVNTDMI